MKTIYCTILSKYRVYQGMVLYRSLLYNTEYFKLYILCVDEESYEICKKMNLEHASVLRVEAFNKERLISIRQERELNEYCWTLKPFLIEYALKESSSGSCVAYVDADICFFNDPTEIFEKDLCYDVMLSEHDYSLEYINVEEYCGRYNSGFIVFRNVRNAQKALNWWQDRCLEWCYDRVEAGRFGDQKYLDYIPQIFRNIGSIDTPGVNIASWNESKYGIHQVKEKIYINNHKLICYHFSGLRIVEKNKVALVGGKKNPIKILYFPYIQVLKKVIEDIERIDPLFQGFNIEQRFYKDAEYYDI
ncbi:MAG: putative nucleotide-diphospho-sugar transferase [Thermotaleaceae bacterium]